MTTRSTIRNHSHRWDLVIVIDGEPPLRGWRALLAPDAVVIAADGGARHAAHEGVTLTHVVGDFDTLDPREVAALDARGVGVHRHPAAKECTDFELAARLAARIGSSDPNDARLLVVGGAGGRIDHELGNLAVLTGPELAPFATTALLGTAVAQVARGNRPVRILGAPGATVSLLPVGGPACGVHTTGLAYPVHGDDLAAGSSRGMSNRVVHDDARVRVDAGVLLVVEPDAFWTLTDP